MDVTIVGAGAMGGALTVPLTDNDHSTSLWGTNYDIEIIDALEKGKPHPRIDTELPSSVRLLGPDSLEEALQGADLVVLGVSSAGVVPVTKKIAPLMKEDVPVVSIAKGLIEYEGEPWMIEEGMVRILRDHGTGGIPQVACLGGPSIAQELAERSPTAVGVASRDIDLAREVEELLGTSYFELEPSADIEGLQTCIGFKNSYAIGLAWTVGLPEGLHKKSISGMSNLKAILFLKTLEELKTIARAVGGDPETVMGFPGLGDLVTTSGAGRNGTMGRLLGRGNSTEEALEELRSRGVGVIEGYETAELGMELVRSIEKNGELNIEDLDFFREINRVLYEDKAVIDAIDDLSI